MTYCTGHLIYYPLERVEFSLMTRQKLRGRGCVLRVQQTKVKYGSWRQWENGGAAAAKKIK